MLTRKANTRLEELEVEEVSIVDRPANRRKFLIVKRQEEEMSGSREDSELEVTIEDQGDDDALSLLLDMEDLDEVENEEPDDDPPPPPEDEEASEFHQIFKATTAGGALKVAQSALGKLMAAVNAMKRLGGKPMTPAIAGALKGVAGALGLMSGAGKAEKPKTEKAQEDMLKQATSAMERLMSLVNKLKDMEAGETPPPAVFAEAKAIAGLLQGLLGKSNPKAGEKQDDKEEGDGEPPEDDKKKKTKKRFQIFVPADQPADGDVDPELIFKAGAKMKKTRLSKLREAVKLLSEVLGEIDPSDDDAKNKKKEKSEKREGDEPGTLQAAITSVADSVKQLVERVDKLANDVSGQIETIGKRVDTLEGEAPPPTDTEDTEDIRKGEPAKSLFHDVINRQ